MVRSDQRKGERRMVKVTSMGMAVVLVLGLLAGQVSAVSLRAQTRLHLASRAKLLMGLDELKKNKNKRGPFKAQLVADTADPCILHFNLTYTGNQDVSVLTIGTPLANVPGTEVFYGTNKCYYSGATVEYDEDAIHFTESTTVSLSSTSPSAGK